MDTEPPVPLLRVATFIRQQTHNLRNALNGLELETALLEDFVNGEEGQAGLGRVRQLLRTMAGDMRAVSSLFQDFRPVTAPILARELLLIWEEKHAALPDAPPVQWRDEVGSEQVRVDVEMIAAVFSELLANAAEFSRGLPLTAAARAEGGKIIFELREEQKEEPDLSAWGEPFCTTSRDSYGLGLWAARRMIEAHGAELRRHFAAEARVLTTQLVFAAM